MRRNLDIYNNLAHVSLTIEYFVLIVQTLLAMGANTSTPAAAVAAQQDPASPQPAGAPSEAVRLLVHIFC